MIEKMSCTLKKEGGDYIFHCWENYSEIIPPSPVRGGHPGGTMSRVMAIIEDSKTGDVYRVEATDIRFTNVVAKTPVSTDAPIENFLEYLNGGSKTNGVTAMTVKNLIEKLEKYPSDASVIGDPHHPLTIVVNDPDKRCVQFSYEYIPDHIKED